MAGRSGTSFECISLDPQPNGYPPSDWSSLLRGASRWARKAFLARINVMRIRLDCSIVSLMKMSSEPTRLHVMLMCEHDFRAGPLGQVIS